MQYVSPGDAFSSTLEQSLLARANQQRQAEMDQLAMQREARAMRREQEEAAQAKDALAEKRQEFADVQKGKRQAAFEKSLGTMVPGDIPTPELIAQAKEFGLGHLFPESEPAAPVMAAAAPAAITPAPAAAIAAAPEPALPAPLAPPQAAVGPQQEAVDPALPPVAPKPVLPPAVRFLGTPAQRQDAEHKKLAMDIIGNMEPGPQRSALELAVQSGKMPTPSDMKPWKDGGDTEPVARVSANRQVVEVYKNGAWTKVGPEGLPKGTHFIQEPTPPAAHDNSLQKENQRTGAYNHAVTELNKASAPFEDQLKNIESAEEVLNERSPSGDAHVAPMILKALVAGQGSGFRMTKSEIDQVQNARSKWQGMEATFRKWSADPKDALFFDDAQRADFNKLLATMKVVTARHLEQVGRARNDIDLADNPRDIQKRVTAYHTERAATPKGDDVKDKKQVRYDINGKVVK